MLDGFTPFRYAEAEVIDMTLGENLQRLRKEKGLSQEDVARALFVSRQTISKWETDKAEPGVDNLKALADLYEVTLDQLTGRARTGTDSKESYEQTPSDQYRTMALIRLAVWLAVAAAGQLHGGEPFQILAFAGTLGSAAVFLSLWFRSIYIWGGILCGEGLSILVSAACTICAKQLASGMISVGLAAMLGIWVKYLTSQSVRQLFYEK